MERRPFSRRESQSVRREEQLESSWMSIIIMLCSTLQVNASAPSSYQHISSLSAVSIPTSTFYSINNIPPAYLPLLLLLGRTALLFFSCPLLLPSTLPWVKINTTSEEPDILLSLPLHRRRLSALTSSTFLGPPFPVLLPPTPSPPLLRRSFNSSCTTDEEKGDKRKNSHSVSFAGSVSIDATDSSSSSMVLLNTLCH